MYPETLSSVSITDLFNLVLMRFCAIYVRGILIYFLQKYIKGIALCAIRFNSWWHSDDIDLGQYWLKQWLGAVSWLFTKGALWHSSQEATSQEVLMNLLYVFGNGTSKITLIPLRGSRLLVHFVHIVTTITRPGHTSIIFFTLCANAMENSFCLFQGMWDLAGLNINIQSMGNPFAISVIFTKAVVDAFHCFDNAKKMKSVFLTECVKTVLTHRGQVKHYISVQGRHHWLRLWPVTWSAPSHYLNQKCGRENVRHFVSALMC